ncbi:ARM repeat-containing protein [Ramicandelaber brevisporus]|nr:ARM repeat-containing protein [Ramicandelaber brevisporus]
MNEQHVQVVQAIEALSAPNVDRETRQRADEWLQTFRKTNAAWTVCDSLLHSPQMKPDVKLFAAQSLRSKVLYDLTELDVANRISLRDSLLALFGAAHSLPRNVQRQLSLALADLALQVPEWTGVVPEMIEKYGGRAETASSLIEFLTALPEEARGDRLIVSDAVYRSRTEELLTQGSTHVIRYLAETSQVHSSNMTAQALVLRCLDKWLESGDVQIDILAETQLFNLAFQALASEELFDEAAEAACRIITEAQNDDAYIDIVRRMIVPNMRGILEQLQREIASGVLNDDEERHRAYTRIFTEAADSYISSIIEDPHEFGVIVEGLLMCIKIPAFEVNQMSFNFWNLLSEELYKHSATEVIAEFKPLFSQLMDTLFIQLRYPDDIAAFSSKQRDEFREFRHAVGDVLKSCVSILGGNFALVRIYNFINQCMDTINSLSSGTNTPSRSGSNTPTTVNPPSIQWQDLELATIALRTIGAMIPDDENEIMPNIMNLLMKFPPNSKVRYGVTLVIARYTMWTLNHPSFVQPQLEYIAQGFYDEEVSPAACKALRYLCLDCGSLMLNSISQLHSFYSNMPSTVSNRGTVEVSEAISLALSHMPPSNTLNALREFCNPVVQKIMSLTSGYLAQLTESQKTELANLFVRLKKLLHHVIPFRSESAPEVANAVAPLAIELISGACGILPGFGSHPEIAEAISGLLVTCFEMYYQYLDDTVPTVMEQLIKCYDQTEYGCYIWAARQCIDTAMYDLTKPEAAQRAITYFEHLAHSILRRGASNINVYSPDVIEEFFRTCELTFSSLPREFLLSNALPSVVEFGTYAFSIRESHALGATMAFMRHLANSIARSVTGNHSGDGSNAHLDVANNVMRTACEPMLTNVLEGCIHGYSYDMVELGIDLIVFIAKCLPNEVTQAIGKWLQSLPDAVCPPQSRLKAMERIQGNIVRQMDDLIFREMMDFIHYCRRRQRA